MSYGKTGVRVREQLAEIAELVDDPHDADVNMFLGVPCSETKGKDGSVASNGFEFVGGARRVWFTMCEMPEFPESHIAALNESDAIFTPSSWCGEVYQRRGVTTPRFRVPLGVDLQTYFFDAARKERDRPFTFLWVGICTGHIRQLAKGDPIGDRKRGWLVRHAFQELNLPDSRLILKSVPFPSGRMDFKYRLENGGIVHNFSEWISEGAMADLFMDADVLVWPTWGEGFGLPPLEAAACGTPSILPNFSAITDYFDPAWCIDLPHTVNLIWRRGEDITGACVTIQALKEKMLWAYNHRDTIRTMGNRAHKEAQGWAWNRKCRTALEQMLNNTRR